MPDTLIPFIAQAVAISLSGVMAPGVVTAATLAAGTRNRHAGAWIALGHGIVEFPLMGLIMAGAGAFLAAASFRIGIGLAGGAMLVLMAGMLLASARKPILAAQPVNSIRPIWTGIALTIGNPLFLLWWATTGLALATRAVELGVITVAVFAVAHWICDLLWLEALSNISSRGVGFMGPLGGKFLTIACAATMAGFGIWFIAGAVKSI